MQRQKPGFLSASNLRRTPLVAELLWKAANSNEPIHPVRICKAPPEPTKH